MPLNRTALIAGGILLFAFCLALNRDLLLEQTGTVDLRNRVVGARLQMDGKTPYTYKWAEGDSLRYYDQLNMGTGVSISTASPFFHTLLYPIANLPQRTISYIWFFVEYALLFISGLLALRLAKSDHQKIAVAITLALFLFTEAWKNHIVTGQLYLFIPCLAMTFYYFIRKRDNYVAAFLAGLFAIVLVMIRPNTVVFFIPFLFLISDYTRKYLLVLLIPVIMLPACYFSFKNNRNYLTSYTYAVQESIKGHQSYFYPGKPHPPIKMVYLPEWEGWNKAAIDSLNKVLKPYKYSDHGNVFVVYMAITKKHMPISVMNLLSALFILVFAGICFRLRKTQKHIELPNIAIFGFCLYMISDLFSPVWRHQYYTTQWLFPLLLAAAVYQKANKRVYVLLLAGLVLNIVNSSYMKMEHTIGEYLMLFTLIYLSLMKPLAGEVKTGRGIN
jgi:hypothetical protein